MIPLIITLSIPALAALVIYFRHLEHSQEASEARKDARAAQERVDRLTEALSRKAGVDLILPAPPLPPLEKIPGYFDRKTNPRISISLKGESHEN